MAEKNKLAGRTVDRPALLDKVHKQKTRVVNKSRKEILKAFGKINKIPAAGEVFARITRQVVGPSLHAVKIEVNGYCNQKCRTCYNSNEAGDMDRAIIRSIAEDIAGCSINTEIIGGEPLMRDDIAEIVHEMKTIGESPRVSLYTNGVLANEEMVTKLKDAGLDAATVTLHSHIEELHDSITQIPGSYQQTLLGIKEFQKAGIKVYVATVVHKENLDSIQKTCDFIEDELCASAVFTKYIPNGAEDPFMLTSREWRGFKHWLKQSKKADHVKEVEDFFSLTGSCPSGNYVVAVKVDGIVQPCPFATGITLGTIPESSLSEIYEKRFDIDAFVNLKKIPNKCEPCVLKHLCGGGCRSASYGVFDGLCGIDPLCGGPYLEQPKDEDVMDLLPIHY